MRLRFSLTSFLILLVVFCKAQENAIYCHDIDSTYTECYRFNKLNRTFVHEICDTRVIEFWTGKGTYKETKRQYILSYNAPPMEYIRYTTKSTIANDSAKVYWLEMDSSIGSLKVIGRDSTDKVVFTGHSDFIDSFIYIPRHLCNLGYTYTGYWGSQEIATLKVDTNTDEVILHKHHPFFHSIYATHAVLNKTKGGLNANLYWSKQTAFFKLSTPPPPPVSFTNAACFRNRNHTIAELLKGFPFSGASTIKLVAFEAKHARVPLDKNGVLVDSSCKQILVLSQKQIDSLVDLLYNYNYSDSLTVKRVTVSACYEPRHAILFYNNDGKLFAYLEICFECTEIASNIRIDAFGDFCEGKYELLENFFRQSGITFFSKDDKTSGFRKEAEYPTSE